MFKFVIYDDNDLELNLLANSINIACKDQGIDCTLNKFNSLHQTLEHAKCSQGSNVIYMLDIMSANGKEDGLIIAEEIRKYDQTAYIIFVSGHHEYVLLAFKKQPFDFIVKPFTEKIIQDLIQRIRIHFDAVYNEKNPFFILESGSISNKIFVNEITYLEKDNNLLIVRTIRGIFKGYLSFKDALLLLEKYGFSLCHKSYLVNPNSSLIRGC